MAVSGMLTTEWDSLNYLNLHTKYILGMKREMLIYESMNHIYFRREIFVKHVANELREMRKSLLK